MKKCTSLVILLFIAVTATAQIKGNRNVVNKQRNLESFSSVEISGSFEVIIKRGEVALAEIEADENLQDLIRTDVVNNVLIVRSEKNIKRAKRERIMLKVPSNLEKITLKDEVELDLSDGINFPDLEIQTLDDSKLYATLTTSNFKLIAGNDSKIELNLTTKKQAYIQLNGKSYLKALINGPSLKIDTYEDAKARIEGTVEDFRLRTDHSTEFEGEKLTATNASVTAEGRSKNEISVIKNLRLIAKNRSETRIYNNPKIELIEFSDQAVLRKEK
ncbi:GIN domain-containing protein [Zunongwangia sp.]|uniref:GIN domain-containing protein n=1 Tax=Zunongwangia sp. TaxID=1965325 RepID=UPI003AA86E81